MEPSGSFPHSKATSTKGGPGNGCPPSCFLWFPIHAIEEDRQGEYEVALQSR